MAQDAPGLPSPPSLIIDVFAEADRLTQRLRDAEQHFVSIPWRVETKIEDGLTALHFERTARGWALGWKTKLTANHPWGPTVLLKDSAVELKAKASKLLPRLLDKMRVEYDARVSNLAEGHAALDAFERVIAQARKEGA